MNFCPDANRIGAGDLTRAGAFPSLAAQARSQLGSSAAGCAQTRSSTKGCLQSFGVDFIDPVNPASLSDRATKYGILFIVLTFAGIVLLEVLKGQAVHPVQYLLIGAAMAVFFLLLLSLSEHRLHQGVCDSGCGLRGPADGVCEGSLGRLAASATDVGGACGALRVLYLVLQSEQHALLAGSLLVFAVLAG